MQGLGVGKQRDAGNVEFYGALGVAHRLIDTEPVDARHRSDACALVVAIDHEQRPDQVIRGENVFPNQPARPFGFPIAARANHQIERGAGEEGVPPRRVAHFDRTPEFDRHVNVSPKDGRPDWTGSNLNTLYCLRHRSLDLPQSLRSFPTIALARIDFAAPRAHELLQ